MICNEVKARHADRLNGLWNLSCSSAILDPAILSDLVKNGFYQSVLLHDRAGIAMAC